MAPLVREAEAFLERHGVQGRALFTAQLVLEELVTNAVRHAYGEDARGEVTVQAAVDDGGVLLIIEDTGPPFDPLEDAPDTDIGECLEDRCAGGMGLHLIQQMVDDWGYQRDGSTNRVRARVAHTAG